MIRTSVTITKAKTEKAFCVVLLDQLIEVEEKMKTLKTFQNKYLLPDNQGNNFTLKTNVKISEIYEGEYDANFKPEKRKGLAPYAGFIVLTDNNDNVKFISFTFEEFKEDSTPVYVEKENKTLKTTAQLLYYVSNWITFRLRGEKKLKLIKWTIGKAAVPKFLEENKVYSEKEWAENQAGKRVIVKETGYSVAGYIGRTSAKIFSRIVNETGKDLELEKNVGLEKEEKFEEVVKAYMSRRHNDEFITFINGVMYGTPSFFTEEGHFKMKKFFFRLRDLGVIRKYARMTVSYEKGEEVWYDEKGKELPQPQMEEINPKVILTKKRRQKPKTVAPAKVETEKEKEASKG